MPPTNLHGAACRSHTLKDRAKATLGGLLFRAETKRWTTYVRGHPILCDLYRSAPRIVHKIYRPYLSNHLSCGDRVAALMSHYTAIIEMGLGQLVLAAAGAPVTLAACLGKSGTPIVVQLAAIGVAPREGELALLLVAEGRVVYTASFVLLTIEGQLKIALGSLQGLRADDGAIVMRRLTRDLHGCRPINFMIAVLRNLGACLGSTRLILVSNRNRVVVNWRRSARISSDYDAIWRELHAAARADGNFELPCIPHPHHPNLSVVPTRKRSEFRKRHALLADIVRQLTGSLVRTSVPPPVAIAQSRMPNRVAVRVP